jgi:peptide/nickel transport system permease protein
MVRSGGVLAEAAEQKRRDDPAVTEVPRERRVRKWRAVLRATVLYAVTLFAAVTVIFAIPRAMPGDPIQAREDPTDSLYVSDATARARLMAYYGLDKPLVTQYRQYLVRIAHGDFGWSIARNLPVRDLVGQHLPWTLLLMGTGLALSSGISFLAGIGAAWRRGTVRDRVLVVTMTGARAVPEYALAAVLLIVFAVLLPVFPLYGATTPFAEYASPLAKVIDIGRHLALPATALTMGLLGNKFLLVRNTTIGVLGEDYMVLARAKGLSDRRLKFHHAGRNSLLPFLTVLGIQVGFAVGGSVFVESVFAYPGMGSLILRAVEQRDYPVLEGCFLTLATAVLLANFLIELVYTRLDPRVGARS